MAALLRDIHRICMMSRIPRNEADILHQQCNELYSLFYTKFGPLACTLKVHMISHMAESLKYMGTKSPFYISFHCFLECNIASTI